MKHILKKFHFGGGGGGNHESSASASSGRSNELLATAAPSGSSSSPLTSPSFSSSAPTLTSAPNTVSSMLDPSSSTIGLPSSVSTLPTSAADSDAVSSAIRAQMVAADYFSSEEEFQVQLAMAISASDSELLEDPHNHQIRAATLLSLGKHHHDRSRKAVDTTAGSLSRRYWDYNVLDYDEKILDGFYDIFVLSADSAGHGKMPSLSDLQANTRDHGFEVILVNRPIDRSLQELEQVAECIALDCQHAEISVLVQKIADVVTEHMGGPVRDANDLLARWMEKSTTLRTSLQTSLLPIGGVNIGLSRHRALLFKVLADKVGIPCKLVKGSHYTGIDDDAVNIIRVGSDREFLVDLMAAPGILIPADVLNTKDSSKSSFNSRLTESSSRVKSDSNFVNTKAYAGYSKENEKLEEENGGHTDRMPSLEKAGIVSFFPSSGNGLIPSSSECYFDEDKDLYPDDQHNKSSPIFHSSSMSKDNLGMFITSDNLKEKHNSNIQDNVDSEDLFAELNPFQVTGVGKTSSQFKITEKKTNGFQRRRENVSSGPGRPPLPLVWKNRSPCNEFPNNKHKDFSEGVFPRKNTEGNDLTSFPSASSTSASPRKIFPENFKTTGGHISESSSIVMADETRLPLRTSQHAMSISDHENVRSDDPFISLQPYEDKCQVVDGEFKMGSQNTNVLDQKVHGKYTDRHERRKYAHDRFMGTDMVFKDGDSPGLNLFRSGRLDPMFDDVAELEIPWEDLIIGERIGLGSYGEVYHADWNGTEVAVKKFLDQDFYGDALDEFRSEVRIMRRLRHPNVVLFMGAVTRPPNLSIITEFLPRGSLYRLLHRPNCQIDQKRRIKMALDVAKGMNCLHTSTPTIVHRDLKSPNLLVDKNWNVKVCDFGLSRLKHNTFLSSKSTAGTPEWMAPEVLRNENSNEKCDVYSFGVILWELATLRMPWSGMNPMQVVGAVGFQNRRLDIPKELDPLVARIIWECWEIDPGMRPSFAQLTSALKPLQQLVIPFDEDMQSPSLPKEIKVDSAP